MTAKFSKFLFLPTRGVTVWRRAAACGLVLIAGLAGCSTMGAKPPAGGASAPAAGGSAGAGVAPGGGAAPTAPRPSTGAPISAAGVAPGSPQVGGPPQAPPQQPFAAVIRDAKKTEGLFTLYQKDEKAWIALEPEDFDKPFFLAPKLVSGIGEAFLYGGRFDEAQVIQFRRVNNQVQMIAVNTRYKATPGTPEARAVAAAFSPSLLASAVIVSQPHPTSKAVLLELGSLFMNDMLGIAGDLQRAYRQGYGFDPRNSAITRLRGNDDMVALEVMAHYATASIALPTPGTPPGIPLPSVPRSLPDPRSLFMTLQYSISALPEEPMRPRAADPRIGYFTTRQADFGNDIARSPADRHINRWRLEKKEPTAALSEPVKPLVYWIDRTIPLKYRDAITGGILEWNKAFEAIGFKDAIVVKLQPDDADFDSLDPGAGSVRWMTNSSPFFAAIGLTQVDPRSGEILAANISIESLSTRARRQQRAEVLPPTAIDWRVLTQQQSPAERDDPRRNAFRCDYADVASSQLSYGLDVLSARGEIDPSGPIAEQFVLDYLRETAMHEAGHTLGLRHNFRASRAYSERQLSDPEFTRSHALAGSVMDYTPINLAGPGLPAVSPFQRTLGPYDFWAVEYAYKPIAPADERAELKRIAARSNQPELAFGTDEDNFLGIDPESLQWDLGSDPIAFARKRIAIARDLFARQETRALAPDQDYTVLRRTLGYSIVDVAQSVGVLVRQIGGVRTYRDFAGSGRDPMEPVSAGLQREAIDVLSRGILAADAFVISPALQRRLAPDYLERDDALSGSGDGPVATDFYLTQRVVALQRALLNALMSDQVASRVLDNQSKFDRRSDALQLSDLYGRLERDIWSELGRNADIPIARREVQREHVNHLTALLLRPSAASRTDTRSLVRVQAQALLTRVVAAERHRALGSDARSHLQDCADSLAQALAAKVQRVGL